MRDHLTPFEARSASDRPRTPGWGLGKRSPIRTRLFGWKSSKVRCAGQQFRRTRPFGQAFRCRKVVRPASRPGRGCKARLGPTRKKSSRTVQYRRISVSNTEPVNVIHSEQIRRHDRPSCRSRLSCPVGGESSYFCILSRFFVDEAVIAALYYRRGGGTMAITDCGGFRSFTHDIAGEVCPARPEDAPEHVPAARPSCLLAKRVAYPITSGRSAARRRRYTCFAGGVDDGSAGDRGWRDLAWRFS